jgi:internalin A
MKKRKKKRLTKSEKIIQRINDAKNPHNKILNLFGFRLKELPEEIFKFTHLQILKLDFNNLTELPDSISNLEDLRELHLYVNEISHIPESIRKLSRLKYINLGCNKLEEFPSILVSLKNLEFLQIDESPLKNIPEDINQLQKLKTLNLNFNDLKKIPKSICDLRGLEKLNLRRNRFIEKIPHSIGDLSKLTYLDIGDNRIKEIPDSICNLFRLKELLCYDNHLTRIPNGIGNLTNLSKLNLSRNKIDEIPPTIKNLRKLRRLDLSENRISSIPEEMYSLKSLRRVDLHKNRIKYIQGSIACLKRIKFLDIGNNQLKSIPKSLSELKLIRHLGFNHNHINSLPFELWTLSKLENLELTNNKISYIPIEIAEECNWDLDRLNHSGRLRLDILNNPLKSPPIEIIENGQNATKNYYDSIKDEKTILNEVKVLLVGEGASGKTSLLNIFRNREFDEHESQTDGINIEHDETPTDDGIVKIHYWDFGGQEIMHATHQFFLSKRSLYILVIDKRREEKSEYWLKLIQSFGGDSPVIVALNKMDENPSFSVDKRRLKEKYPNIMGFFHISCKENTGLDDLKTRVVELLKQTPLYGTIWAPKWYRIKEHLENEDQPFIPYETYKKICEGYNLDDESTQQTLVRFLNDLGSVIHFSDPTLEHTHVLKPRWITEAVYRIINSPLLAESKGRIKREDLKEILKTSYEDKFDYPLDKHDYIINLMKKFEICYPYDSSDDVLLPGLLEVESPEFEFAKTDAINFIVAYEFLPKSIFLRLMVQLHKTINIKWRTGFVIHDARSESKALITVDQEQKRIYISVNGNNRKDYFAYLLFTLRQLNRSFENLKEVELIPMPDNPEYVMGYDDLLFQLEQDQEYCFPSGARKKYKIKDLLGIVSYVDEPLTIILKKLEQIHADVKPDDPDSLSKAADKILQFKPSLFGLELDVKELIKLIGKENFKERAKNLLEYKKPKDHEDPSKSTDGIA